MKLPTEILEKAVQLRDPLRDIYIALYTSGKPSSATEIAELTGKARAYVNMRLNQLTDMGLVKYFKKGGTKLYVIGRKENEV